MKLLTFTPRQIYDMIPENPSQYTKTMENDRVVVTAIGSSRNVDIKVDLDENITNCNVTCICNLSKNITGGCAFSIVGSSSSIFYTEYAYLVGGVNRYVTIEGFTSVSFNVIRFRMNVPTSHVMSIGRFSILIGDVL